MTEFVQGQVFHMHRIYINNGAAFSTFRQMLLTLKMPQNTSLLMGQLYQGY